MSSNRPPHTKLSSILEILKFLNCSYFTKIMTRKPKIGNLTNMTELYPFLKSKKWYLLFKGILWSREITAIHNCNLGFFQILFMVVFSQHPSDTEPVPYFWWNQDGGSSHQRCSRTSFCLKVHQACCSLQHSENRCLMPCLHKTHLPQQIGNLGKSINMFTQAHFTVVNWILSFADDNYHHRSIALSTQQVLWNARRQHVNIWWQMCHIYHSKVAFTVP